MCIDIARYLEVILSTLLIWSPHNDQVYYYFYYYNYYYYFY